MSSLELVSRYLVERWRPRVLIPLALLLVGAGWIMAAPAAGTVSDVALKSVQALLLILAYRVWDDLEDRQRDSREHPERVMVTDGRATPFVILAMVLGSAGVAPIADAPRLVVLGVASFALLTWYRLRPVASRGAPWDYVVLIKYPAIAVALMPTGIRADGQPAMWRAAATLAVLYTLLCVYETFDDPAIRGGGKS